MDTIDGHVGRRSGAARPSRLRSEPACAQRLAFSRAAFIDRDIVVADCDTQNGSDLVAAQRRRLERVVGWQLRQWFLIWPESMW